MKIFSPILFSWFCLSLQAQSVFYNSYEEASYMAKEKNIGTFIEVCSDSKKNCKKLKEEVYSNREIADIIKLNFAKARIDPNLDNSFVRGYEIKSIPTLIFIDKDGTEVDRIVGYKDARSTIKDIKSITRSLTGIYDLRKKYMANKKDNVLLKKYHSLLTSKGFSGDARRLIPQFFNNIDNHPKAEDIEFIYTSADHPRSQSFKYILDNLTHFDTIYSIKSINKQLMTAMTNSLSEEDIDDTEYVERRMKSVFRGYDYKRFYYSYIIEHYAHDEAMVDQYCKSAINTIKILRCADPEYSNNLAVSVMLKREDESFLKGFKNGLAYCFEKTHDIASLDLLSVITYKLGKKEEAIKMVQQATKLAFDQDMRFESSLLYFREIGYLE